MRSFLLPVAVGIISSCISLVSAHTQIWYPDWRADSFDLPYSQTIYPCAGISDNSTTPRTPWPLNGGSLNVTLHDEAAYIFINLGFGANTTNFNISLFAAPRNETGPGNLCFPKLMLPSGLGIEEGTEASLQFATAGHNGEGLYNCADIVFTSNATLLPASQCVNSSTVSIGLLDGTTSGSIGTSTNSSSSSSSPAASASSSSSGSGAKDFIPSSLILLLLAGLLSVMW